MSKRTIKLEDWFRLASVAFVTAAALMLPCLSWAQQGGSDLAETAMNLQMDEMSQMPNLAAAICYVGGIFMMVSGTLKLKDHAENPASAKIAPGLARLFAGSGLASLPLLTGWIYSTSQVGGSTTSFISFGKTMSIR